ncbi:MAG: PorV/PorQ family protein [Calditrichaeota bacterium]|nr:PorV/PorQ family protein [Calditrichota bacterium]
MKKTIVAMMMALATAGLVGQAFAGGVSKSAVLFLRIAPGARAAGMGESFCAVADDATAVYWNPAGLAFQKGREITLMHAKWLPQLADDLFYEFGAFRLPIEGLGTFGFNVTYINYGEQIWTGEEGPEELGRFTSYEFAVSAHYATKLNDNLGLGLSMRYIRSSLADVPIGAAKDPGKATAFSMDLSALYKAPWLRGLALGANLSNMGPKITYVDADQADPLPTNLSLGASYRLVDTEYNKLTLAVQGDKELVRRYKDGTSDPFYKAIFTSWTDDSFSEELKEWILGAGVEYWYANLIALRAGYHYDEIGKVKFPSFGAGIQYSLYRFDFGYVAAAEGHPLAGTMRFSLTIGF